MRRHLKDAVRALLLRRLDTGSFVATVPEVAGLVVLGCVGVGAVSFLLAGADRRFYPFGITTLLAMPAVLALLVALTSLIRSGAEQSRAYVGLLSVSAVTSLLAAAILGGLHLAEGRVALPGAEPAQIQLAVALAMLAWLAAATLALGWRLAARRRWLYAPALLLALGGHSFVVPGIDVFEGAEAMRPEFNLVQATMDALRPRQPQGQGQAARPRVDVESTYYRQQAMVAAAVSRLERSRPDRREIYFLGAATYSEQDVFKREISSARAIVDERLGTVGRSMLLINHASTLDETPLGNVRNIELSLQGIAQVMDRAKDILVLFLTSHGTEGELAVHFPGFSMRGLTPDRLRQALDRSGIVNRIVVISACHSGSFIPALRSEHTLIMTAARADRTSFGCSNEREWTYFGDALFNRALRGAPTLEAAFEEARKLIDAWEAKDKLTPSEPQMWAGAGIKSLLDELPRMAAAPIPAPPPPDEAPAAAAPGSARE